jgi:hypothetical protein
MLLGEQSVRGSRVVPVHLMGVVHPMEAILIMFPGGDYLTTVQGSSTDAQGIQLVRGALRQVNYGFRLGHSSPP